ncbi:hypothetical protein JCM18920_1230 [Cutibacterium acnes JCM 18920]|nr:hypothetical protein JCM18920_1230 [Cutibacterium acnes JCM 18920]
MIPSASAPTPLPTANAIDAKVNMASCGLLATPADQDSAASTASASTLCPCSDG